jgi:hypothetical protein
MDASVSVTFVDNTKAVIKASEEGSVKALRSSGAYINKVARNSIKRKKPIKDPKTGRLIRPGSTPGTPPNTYSGHIKKVLRFFVDKQEQSVRMGPINVFAETIWDRLEKGGAYKDKPRKHLKRRTFAMGDFGPIAADGYGRKVRNIQLKTAAQVRRANELIEVVNNRRDAEAQKSRTYPARPFMGPALAKSQAKVASFWEGAIK